MSQRRGRGRNAPPTEVRRSRIPAATTTHPGHAALRRGRVLLPGMWYFVTVRVALARNVLRNPQRARILIEGFQWLRAHAWARLGGYIVMPDHFHLCLQPIGRHRLPEVMRILKGATARLINQQLERAGKFWQDGYWEHGVRNRHDFLSRLEYIHRNPVRAELCLDEADYPYSTAHPSCQDDIDWEALC